MNSKTTWTWVTVAAALFAFIFFYERHLRKDVAPKILLPQLKAPAVTGILVRPGNQAEIRAEPTNGTWRLTRPLVYPAQAAKVEALLAAFQKAPFATYITGQELKNRIQAEVDFGVEPAQMSVVFEQPGHNVHLDIGHRTPPGDQVYIQVLGIRGIYVVDASLLDVLPQTAADWRETALADFARLPFDRVTVTNAGNVLELQWNSTNQLWRMTQPLRSRASNGKVEEALIRLTHLRAVEFVKDDPKADLESFGLQPPQLTLTLAQGTNAMLVVDFGHTNNTGLVYARRHNQPTILTVSNDVIEPWRAAHEVFRDRHLMAITTLPDSIEIQAQDTFTLERQTNGAWTINPQAFPVDTTLVEELVGLFAGLQVSAFERDSVTDTDLPNYGLAPPARQYILKWESAASPENAVKAVSFGTREDKVFARRVGEIPIYAIRPADFERLPAASWQMRDRRIWNFSEDDVSRIISRQGGNTRELVRRGTNEWSIAAGSSGVINVFAVEETAHRLGELMAEKWVDRGEGNRARYGLTPEALQVSIELKDGRKLNVDVGGPAGQESAYAAAQLDNETWIFQLPVVTYQLLQLYLGVPATP